MTEGIIRNSEFRKETVVFDRSKELARDRKLHGVVATVSALTANAGQAVASMVGQSMRSDVVSGQVELVANLNDPAQRRPRAIASTLDLFMLGT